MCAQLQHPFHIRVESSTIKKTLSLHCEEGWCHPLNNHLPHWWSPPLLEADCWWMQAGLVKVMPTGRVQRTASLSTPAAPAPAYCTGLILCLASTTAGNTAPDGRRDHHPHTCLNTTQDRHMNAQKAAERSAHALSVVRTECTVYFNSTFSASANFGPLSSAWEQQRGSKFSPHAFTPISQ